MSEADHSPLFIVSHLRMSGASAQPVCFHDMGRDNFVFAFTSNPIMGAGVR